MVTSSQQLYLAFLGLVVMERCAELVISRRHARLAMAAGGFEVGQAHYGPMAALHAAFLASCAGEVLGLHRPFPGLIGWVALALSLFAQGLRYSAIAALGKRWNVRIIVWPDAPPITRGPYRFLRHPNYVAVALELACIPLIHGAYVTALIFTSCNAVMLAVRIREEERALGPSYAETFRDRPRFVPRFFGG